MWNRFLRNSNKDDFRVTRTPLENNLHLSKNRGESISHVEYSKVIGSLMYLICCTKPNIAYTVSKLSKYTSNPSVEHRKTIVRVFRYLWYTHNYGLHYTRCLVVLEGYNDANLISDMKDSKSTSGYVFILADVAVS